MVLLFQLATFGPLKVEPMRLGKSAGLLVRMQVHIAFSNLILQFIQTAVQPLALRWQRKTTAKNAREGDSRRKYE
jgi:hypothetical protein